MNKTVTVNIGGRVFNIEESAYQKLNNYIETIRSYFDGSEGVDEIISDIELRIAELFMERVTDQKQVITNADVDYVVSIMGKPEDYVDNDEEEYSESTETSKRVFRDPDNRVFFGVCGGISAYFGWDPIVLRALFVIVTLFYGSGVLIYLILALIIPKAKTTAEKLQMRGEPVTVENISKKVNESVNTMREDIKDFGKKKQVRTATGKIGDFFDDLFNALARILRVLFKIVVKVLGVLLLIIGIGGIVTAVGMAFGLQGFINLHDTHVFGDHQFGALWNGTLVSAWQRGIFITGIALVYFIPIVAFILLGIRLLFDHIRISGVLGIVLLIFWFVGVGLLTATGINTASEFSVETSFNEDADIEIPAVDTLYLDLSSRDAVMYEFSNQLSGRNIFIPEDVTFPGADSTDYMYMGKLRFTVEKNYDSNRFELELKRSSRGSSQKDAVANARQAKTHVEMSGDTLLIHPYFALSEGDKLRGQNAKYILKIPMGKSIHIGESTGHILYDVPNATNTYDGDMTGKTWTMTADGLTCLSCPETEQKIQEDTDTSDNVRERDEWLKEEKERLEKAIEELEKKREMLDEVESE
ncbi:MAG: PspC domain-containing protein [Flavobacteriales bacterium]|nr:PspC domain-containing protein [Flavobacteriales bacterium]